MTASGMTGGLGPALALSAVGLLLAGAVALLVGMLGSEGRHRWIVPLAALVGLAAMAALPFAWTGLVFGRP